MISPQLKPIKVWDLPTRLFHWGLVFLVSVLVITSELGGEWMHWHILSGYMVSGLVLFRIFWGVVGGYHARFINFVRSPRTLLRYSISMSRGEIKHYAGHNPAGAMMVLLLLGALSVQALSGLVTTDDILWSGPLYSWVPDDIAELGGAVHRLLEVGIKLMVVAHILAVIVHKFLLNDPLTAAMIHGRKNLPPSETENVSASKSMLLIGLVLSAAWVGWLWSLPI